MQRWTNCWHCIQYISKQQILFRLTVKWYKYCVLKCVRCLIIWNTINQMGPLLNALYRSSSYNNLMLYCCKLKLIANAAFQSFYCNFIKALAPRLMCIHTYTQVTLYLQCGMKAWFVVVFVCSLAPTSPRSLIFTPDVRGRGDCDAETKRLKEKMRKSKREKPIPQRCSVPCGETKVFLLIHYSKMSLNSFPYSQHQVKGKKVGRENGMNLPV